MKAGLFTILFFIVVLEAKSQDEKPYLSTKLTPYTPELNIIPSSITGTDYAELKTGLDSCQIYIGTGTRKDKDIYWMDVDSPMGGSLSILNLKKDESLNVYKDTIRRKFEGVSAFLENKEFNYMQTIGSKKQLKYSVRRSRRIL